MKQRLTDKFEKSLDEKEMSPAFDLRKNINIRNTFSRLVQMTGINLSTRARDEFDKHPSEFEFVSPDLEMLTVRVKHMNIIDLNAAIVCRLEAIQKYGTEYDRLFALAVIRERERKRNFPHFLKSLFILFSFPLFLFLSF